MLLKFYADESYNNRTFNFGGWLGEESEWNRLESQWRKRIEHEKRKHGKLARYHASDCASLLQDYQGWSVAEQIQHTQKFQAIIARRNLIAICSGVDLAALPRVFTGDAEDPLRGAYDLTVRHLMMMIRASVKRGQGHRVTIIHDQTTGYNGVISDAFYRFLEEAGDRYKELFVTIAPMKWQDCVPLQPADMIAFDTFKLLDGTVHSSARMRRSLQALLGKAAHIEGRYFSEELMLRLKRMHDRRIASGLTIEQTFLLSLILFGGVVGFVLLAR
jgi:hypothetical protein